MKGKYLKKCLRTTFPIIPTVVMIIFVVLKLTNHIDWSWGWGFLPIMLFWGFEALKDLIKGGKQ